MSGKDLFDALGRISEKNAALTVMRSKKAKTRSIIFKTLKITAAAASVLLIIGFAVFMWYFAQKMKDPPVAPAASDTEMQTKDTEMQTKPEDTQPEQQENYVQTLKKAIEEYLSQGYEKIIENIDGTPQITITSYKAPHEAGGQYYGGIYVYDASKIERYGITGYVGEGDAQYGILTDEIKYLAFAAEPDVDFTTNEDVEQVGALSVYKCADLLEDILAVSCLVHFLQQLLPCLRRGPLLLKVLNTRKELRHLTEHHRQELLRRHRFAISTPKHIRLDVLDFSCPTIGEAYLKFLRFLTDTRVLPTFRTDLTTVWRSRMVIVEFSRRLVVRFVSINHR